jgi:hypothetical protein
MDSKVYLRKSRTPPRSTLKSRTERLFTLPFCKLRLRWTWVYTLLRRCAAFFCMAKARFLTQQAFTSRFFNYISSDLDRANARGALALSLGAAINATAPTPEQPCTWCWCGHQSHRTSRRRKWGSQPLIHPTSARLSVFQPQRVSFIPWHLLIPSSFLSLSIYVYGCTICVNSQYIL